MCSAGLPLLRKLIPVEAYFDNIEQRFAKMPSGTERNRRKHTLKDAWRGSYAKLVNAFGWNSGFTSNWAQRTRFPPRVWIPSPAAEGGCDDLPEGMCLVDDEQQAEMVPSLAALTDPDDSWPHDMVQNLRTWTHPRNPKKLCARWVGGGLTK